MTKMVQFRQLVTFARGGGWGSDSPIPEHDLVAIVRGTDFAEIRAGRSVGVPRRWEKRSKLPDRVLRPGDIVLEISGGSSSKGQSTGRALFVNDAVLHSFDCPVIPASFCRVVRIDRSVADPRYAYYGLLDMYNSGRAAEYENQSTGISNFQFERFLDSEALRLPDRHLQIAVAEVLGALDDKIMKNESVVAKVDRLVGDLLVSYIASDRNLTAAPLGSIASINRSKVLPEAGRMLRYVDISSVSSGRLRWPSRVPWATAPSRARRGVSRGNTLWSTVRPNRRSHTLILDEDSELVASTGFAVLSPLGIGPAYLYEVTKRDEFVDYLDSVAEGSAYPAVRPERFATATVPLLSSSRICKFEGAAMPLRERAHAAEIESRWLTALRDLLLPKLMSGQLLIKDAEKVVEDVT